MGLKQFVHFYPDTSSNLPRMTGVDSFIGATEDTAIVLSRYDGDGTLVFRKTYDKCHEVTGGDVVLPQPDGTVIVNK